MNHRKAEDLFNKSELWSETTLSSNKTVWQNQSVIVSRLNGGDSSPVEVYVDI